MFGDDLRSRARDFSKPSGLVRDGKAWLICVNCQNAGKGDYPPPIIPEGDWPRVP
jgi:hypothetical protein